MTPKNALHTLRPTFMGLIGSWNILSSNLLVNLSLPIMALWLHIKCHIFLPDFGPRRLQSTMDALVPHFSHCRSASIQASLGHCGMRRGSLLQHVSTNKSKIDIRNDSLFSEDINCRRDLMANELATEDGFGWETDSDTTSN
jgi:hypothetical protein